MKILIVGAGLAGCTCARLLAEKDNDIILVEKDDYIGGICFDYLSNDKSCYVHKFGPHIFHTFDESVWKFVNRFSDFNHYIHKSFSKVNDDIYPVPVNFNTISKLYGKNIFCKEDMDKLIRDIKIENPQNFEEAALNALGTKVYNLFIKNYMRKQWRVEANRLPVEIFKRIDVRYNFNDTYFFDTFQGVPKNGYVNLLNEMISHKNIHLELNADFNDYDYDLMIYTGEFNDLPYRSTEFIHYEAAVGDIPILCLPNDETYTRITNFNVLHKVEESKIHHYCKEKPANDNEFNKLYPILTLENINLYKTKANEFKLKYKNSLLCGRLSTYKYLDMDDAILQAINLVKTLYK